MCVGRADNGDSGLDGEPVTFSGDGLLARCLQHETDHVRGTVFGDRLSTKVRKKLQKQHDKQPIASLSVCFVHARYRTVP